MTDRTAALAQAVQGAVEVSFAELPSLRGRSFLGDWFAVDSARLPLFDHASYVDENQDTLAEDAYPEGLVEGFHLLALLDHLMNGLMRPEPGTVDGWNYGLDRVRFVSPVLAGERMRLHATVAEVEPRGEGYVLLLRCVVEVEGRERPGFLADWRVLWLPAEDADTSEKTDPEVGRSREDG